ncbi:MAG: addiction module protein [Chloroflexota bacterium]
MANAVPTPPPGFNELDVDEQIEYVQSLWDLIARAPESVPVPDWHREILRDRIAAEADSADAGLTWDDVRGRIDEALRGNSTGA